jgi:phosphoenolpyruvate---glycerone phosphotransferase subunit DhaM
MSERNVNVTSAHLVTGHCWLLDKFGRRIGTSTPGRERRRFRLVGLVLISHSRMLVEGLREMVAQVAGASVAVGIAGGTDDGRLGTSAPRIAAALRSTLAASPDGVVVLLDLGSAALSLDLALEELDPGDRNRVRVSEAPLVEGAVLAAVQASVGASIAEVDAAAASAVTMAKIPRA